MARNSGVLIRQLLCNRHKPFAAGLVVHRHHRRHLLSKSIQNLTAIPSSSQTIDIRSASKPFYYYSLHIPSLQFLQQRRCLSSPSDSNFVLSGPPNLFVIESLGVYYYALKNVEDDRLSAVFYYTAPGCRATCKWVTPIFDELCEQFRRIAIYKVYMDQNDPGTTMDIVGVDHRRLAIGSTLDKLGIHKTPTFHFYLKGERVDELAGSPVRHLKKTLENVYNPFGMKKRRRRGRKDENGGDLSQAVRVRPSQFNATSISYLMYLVGSATCEEKDFKTWCFAKGILSCQEKREQFYNLDDPELRLDWLKSEMAEK